MSAELLRRAATILRERAATVDPGPWERGDNVHGVVVRAGSNWPTGDDDAVTGTDGYAIAGWVAMMHPGVGLALADWLGFMAWQHETFGPNMSGYLLDHSHRALTVARLIVGEAND